MSLISLAGVWLDSALFRWYTCHVNVHSIGHQKAERLLLASGSPGESRLLKIKTVPYIAMLAECGAVFLCLWTQRVSPSTALWGWEFKNSSGVLDCLPEIKKVKR